MSVTTYEAASTRPVSEQKDAGECRPVTVRRFRLFPGEHCPECSKGTMQASCGCVVCTDCGYSPCAG